MKRVKAAAGWVWWWWRQVSGDAAYENYLRRRLQPREGASTPRAQARGQMTAEEFYVATLERRYRGVSRCC